MTKQQQVSNYNSSQKATYWSMRLDYQKHIDNDNIEDQALLVRTEEFILAILQRNAMIASCYYQLERSSRGYMHWQIAVEVTTPMNEFAMRNMFRIPRDNFEYARPAKNWAASINYCQKLRTRVKGPFQYHKPVVAAPLQRLIKFL